MSTGSLAAGQIGFNLNVPNIIAAVFAATGQDVACLAESSSGILQLEQYEKQLDPAGRKPWHGPYAHMERMDEEGGIYASLSLPSLVIGTVGGGTSLATQKECLQLMGCYGKVRMYVRTYAACFVCWYATVKLIFNAVEADSCADTVTGI